MWSSGSKESLFHFHSIIWKRNLDPNPDEAPKRFVLHIQCCICREHGQCEQWIILHQLFFQNCYSPTAFSIPHCYLRCKLENPGSSSCLAFREGKYSHGCHYGKMYFCRKGEEIQISLECLSLFCLFSFSGWCRKSLAWHKHVHWLCTVYLLTISINKIETR